ncbi:MAG: DUF533 domain-containing protein [Mariniblastus sp.]
MGNKSLSSSLGSSLLGGLLGGGQKPAPQQSGLAGILSGVMGGGQQQQSGGALSGLLGSVMGGGGGAAGLLGSVLGGGGAAGLLGSVMGGGAKEEAPAQAPQLAPEQHAEANNQAVIMIRAMVNAAKSDGRIDQSEQEKIISKLGEDVSQSEIDFLKREFAAPVDVAAFASSVPNGLEQQIYAISLTSIELDTQNEAQYLGQLAQGLKMDPSVCNQIHEHLGAPKIFG